MTEFGTHGNVGNERRRKEEGTPKIEMDRWDSRGHRHEFLPDCSSRYIKIGRGGDQLFRLSLGVGIDLTAQGDKVTR